MFSRVWLLRVEPFPVIEFQVAWSCTSSTIFSKEQYLLWDPVTVPQITGGLTPDGLVTVTVSVVQAPVVSWVKTPVSKSSLKD